MRRLLRSRVLLFPLAFLLSGCQLVLPSFGVPGTTTPSAPGPTQAPATPPGYSGTPATPPLPPAIVAIAPLVDPSAYFPVTDLPVRIQGFPDRTAFGDHGVALPGLPGTIYDLKLVDGGKLLVGGSTCDASCNARLARFRADGSPDESFGKSGVVVVPIGSTSITSIALQGDGKIVVGGWGYQPRQRYAGDYADISVFLVGRFLPDGTIDSTFGKGGFTTTRLQNDSAAIRRVVIQPDGKIVAAGFSQWLSPGNFYGTDAAVARYLDDGTLDESLGDGGIILSRLTDATGNVFNDPFGLEVTAGGDIVIATRLFDRGWRWGLLRFGPDGRSDRAFGTNGIVDFSPVSGDAGLNGMCLQADGKIVAVGYSYNQRNQVLLGRFLANGAADPAFGQGGVARADLPGRYGSFGVALALTTANEARVAAFGWNESAGTNSTAVLAFRSDGSLDTGYHGTGIDLGPPVGLSLDPVAIVLTPDGRSIVAGETPLDGRHLFFFQSEP